METVSTKRNTWVACPRCGQKIAIDFYARSLYNQYNSWDPLATILSRLAKR